MVNKRVQNAVLGCNLKNDRMISVCFQGKPFNITVIQAYAPTSNTVNLKLNSSMKTTRSFRTNAQKRCPFYYRGLECKSRKSRNTWSNRQIWPWSTEWSRARLIEFCQENALVIANTLLQQHKRRFYTWHHQIVNTEIRLAPQQFFKLVVTGRSLINLFIYKPAT